MKLLIVEDEQLLVRQLIKIIRKIEPGAEIAGQTNSISQTVEWLQSHADPDLVLMDIELADGQCFEIFNRIQLKSPVIFTTAYDEYALQAFKVNSIDYLLKPVKESELSAAFKKWKLRRQQQAGSGSMPGIDQLIRDMMLRYAEPKYRDRFLVKQGQKMIPVRLEDIAFFNARNTLNFLNTKSRQKFPVNYTLDQVEECIPPDQFFRANRQFILAHDSIAAIHPWFNGKLKVDLIYPSDEDIIISREKAASFKEWMGS